MRMCGHVGPENDDLEFNYRNKELLEWKKKTLLMKCVIKLQNTLMKI